MFSASLEIVLTIAYREAVSRRHSYLTLEHLLYALAHDPEGERILLGCGVEMSRLRRELNDYLDESVERVAQYILENPVRSNLARAPPEYRWSGSNVWPTWRSLYS